METAFARWRRVTPKPNAFDVTLVLDDCYDCKVIKRFSVYTQQGKDEQKGLSVALQANIKKYKLKITQSERGFSDARIDISQHNH